MTKDERNAAIVACYQGGLKLKAIASRFQLGRQRVLQILKSAGVWQPPDRSRTKFLGVTVSETTKDGLARMAEERGTSVSKLTSDALDAVVEGRR